MIKTCKTCNKEFEIKNRTIEYMKSRKFCNINCYWKSPENKNTRFKKGHKCFIEPKKEWTGNHGYRVRTKKGTRTGHLVHRIVMEEHLGRPLKKGEHIHHIDGDRTNNIISNLMLFPSNSAHLKYHWHVLNNFKSRSPKKNNISRKSNA